MTCLKCGGDRQDVDFNQESIMCLTCGQYAFFGDTKDKFDGTGPEPKKPRLGMELFKKKVNPIKRKGDVQWMRYKLAQ